MARSARAPDGAPPASQTSVGFASAHDPRALATVCGTGPAAARWLVTGEAQLERLARCGATWPVVIECPPSVTGRVLTGASTRSAG
jgi:hypothetical protein